MLTTLIILDGFGLSDSKGGNAVFSAKTPYFDQLMAKYPHSKLGASGLDVGLPQGQMGNSEVGHINIGAGRTVYQELTRISKEIEDGDFFNNPDLLLAIKHAKTHNTALHAYGLLSDGGVHSTIQHLFALMDMAKNEGLEDIFIHCFMDGRDVSPVSGAGYIDQLQQHINMRDFGTISTVIGRYYAMDRDNRWQRVQVAYDAMTAGEGSLCEDAAAAVRASYEEGVTDEFIKPIVCTKDGKPTRRIQKDDSIVFFNFRPDRAREITRCFIEPNFAEFERKTGFIAPFYVGFTCYDATFKDFNVAFKPQNISNNLGEVVAAHGLKQLRIAETEKYAHVTFFFNSGNETPNVGEDRVLIPSPKVETYDLQPEMSAYEVAETAAKLIKECKYDLIILNFANCDMVGHTGVFDAAVRAVKAVDDCLKTVVEAVKSVGGVAFITADHGNAEKMLDEDGQVFTAHTTNPVPFVAVKEGEFALENGILADIAPTILTQMGIAVPPEMSGKSLAKTI